MSSWATRVPGRMARYTFTYTLIRANFLILYTIVLKLIATMNFSMYNLLFCYFNQYILQRICPFSDGPNIIIH